MHLLFSVVSGYFITVLKTGIKEMQAKWFKKKAIKHVV